MEAIKYDVFISYRRDGGEYTAKILRDRLEKLGYSVFFDVESLRSGDFNTRLYSVIEECKDFILILSPNALDRCQSEDDWVRRESEYALERGKNIVPVMLRGFEFPESLPPSIERLRFKHGIPANTEFFEAFIQKLQTFLKAKPPLWRRLAQNTALKLALPVFLALVLVAAGVGYALSNRTGPVYPGTEAEKSTVSETLYYIQTELTHLDLIADHAYKSLAEARRYVSSGPVTGTALSSQLDSCQTSIRGLAEDASPPSDRLLDMLADSPFNPAELVALHDLVSSSAQEWIDNIDHISWMLSPNSGLSDSDKLKILDSYQTILDEDMQANAYCANEVLLVVTNESALSDFLYKYLPTLTHIPLIATSWSDSQEALVSAQDASWNKQQKALNDLIAITGEFSMELAKERADLIRQYMASGMSRTQAEQYVEKIMAILNEAYETFSPAEGDSEDVLWAKLRAFMALQLYDGAEACADALGELAKDGGSGAGAYLPALRAFTRCADATGIDYGVMVTAYYEPGGVNEVFEPGDIIVEFNGEPCRNYDEYLAGKNGLSGPDYTVGVLRLNGSGELEPLTLELEGDMPRMALQSLNSKNYE